MVRIASTLRADHRERVAIASTLLPSPNSSYVLPAEHVGSMSVTGIAYQPWQERKGGPHEHETRRSVRRRGIIGVYDGIRAVDDDGYHDNREHDDGTRE